MASLPHMHERSCFPMGRGRQHLNSTFFPAKIRTSFGLSIPPLPIWGGVTIKQCVSKVGTFHVHLGFQYQHQRFPSHATTCGFALWTGRADHNVKITMATTGQNAHEHIPWEAVHQPHTRCLQRDAMLLDAVDQLQRRQVHLRLPQAPQHPRQQPPAVVALCGE